ncbi:hypothetical protein [Photorhabdus heterorhabditis]|nr:hypothetical protein [Photorhabdus heterorhabditis]
MVLLILFLVLFDHCIPRSFIMADAVAAFTAFAMVDVNREVKASGNVA